MAFSKRFFTRISMGYFFSLCGKFKKTQENMNLGQKKVELSTKLLTGVENSTLFFVKKRHEPRSNNTELHLIAQKWIAV